MKEIPKSYIEKRIQKARTPLSELRADSYIERGGHVPAESARFSADLGFEDATASYLHRDTSLTIYQKGEILAEAYAKKSAKLFMDSISRRGTVKDQRDAQTSRRIAYYLRLAAKKAQNI